MMQDFISLILSITKIFLVQHVVASFYLCTDRRLRSSDRQVPEYNSEPCQH